MSPKLKYRPSPVQARILRLLAENNGLLIGWLGKVWWSGTNEAMARREVSSIRVSSLRRLLNAGFLEPIAEGEFYFRITPAGRKAIADLEDDDFIPKATALTAGDVYAALKRHAFPAPSWLFVSELYVRSWRNRRLDGFAMKIAPEKTRDPISISEVYRMTWAIEIKVSRSDFLAEIANPRKREAAVKLCNRFAFAAPAGLINVAEVPNGLGLIEVLPNRKVSLRVPPDYRVAEPPDWDFVASLARAMLRER